VSDDLCRASIADLAPRLESREVSPTEVTQATLERIERLNPKLNAFLTVTAELALEQARGAEAEIAAGNYRGPMHGIPISLKDLYLTRGIRTTGGSKILGDWVPEIDSAVGERLRDAGSILVGKNHMHEFAFGTTNLSPHYGPALNPWNQERVTGGSSGGTAIAVATGMSYMSMGSDTGGSIRMPAALCGVSGIKATYGRVSKYGALPLAWSLDHTGPLARSAEDLAIVLNAIAGHDSRDPTTADRPVPDYRATLNDGVSGLRLGVIQEYMDETVDAECVAAANAAIAELEKLGAHVQTVSFREVTSFLGAATTILHAEGAAYHAQWLIERPDDYSPAVLERLRVGSVIPAIDYVNAQRARRLLVDRALDIMQQVDALVCTTMPVVAPTLEEGNRPEIHGNLARHTRLFNLLGFPTASYPCGFGATGLPVGLQVAGRPWDEATVLRIGHAYQQVTDWHTRWPAVAE
jgi:aspartyl-tRNA(Asn)/glutamyl-tRNA(Gln) amidotransferase subunit A